MPKFIYINTALTIETGNKVKTVYSIYNYDTNTINFYLSNNNNSTLFQTLANWDNRFSPATATVGLTNAENSYYISLEITDSDGRLFSLNPIVTVLNTNETLSTFSFSTDSFSQAKSILGNYLEGVSELDYAGAEEEWNFYKPKYVFKNNQSFTLDQDHSLTPTNTGGFIYPVVTAFIETLRKDNSIETCNIGTSVITNTSVSYLGQPLSNNFHSRYSIEGTAIVFNTSDGEIIQEYQAQVNHNYNRNIQYDGSNNVTGWTPSNSITQPKDISNVLKFKRNQSEITLNTSDFGIVNADNSNVVVSTINTNSTSFTITINYTGNRYIKNLNITEVLTLDNVVRQEFDASSFTGTYLFSHQINSVEHLIRGTIVSSIYNPTNGNFQITCSISSIVETPTSFTNFFILNNGSFYNYYFRKNIPIKKLPYNLSNDSLPWYMYDYANGGLIDFDLFLNKSLLPIIPLNPTFLSLHKASYLLDSAFYLNTYLQGIRGFQDTYSLNSKTDNIVGDKIYSVIKTESNTAWIEQWNIESNGNVLYNSVFTTEYTPLLTPGTNEELTVYASSYYPS